MDYINELDRALTYIEENLKAELDLQLISDQVKISQFHFHRIFKAVINETVMEYVRTRRLSQAFVDLLKTDKRIIDIAIDYGFESQQSFTRAFKKYFGTSPGKARKNPQSYEHNGRSTFSVKVLHNMREHQRYEPEIIKMEAIKLVGAQRIVDLKSNMDDDIATKAWDELVAKLDQIENRATKRTYGVEKYPEDYGPLNNNFEYIAAVDVTSFTKVPEGLITFELPERHYVVYTFKGIATPETMTQFFANIYGQWILNLPYEMYSDFDFELYDEHYSPGNVDSFMRVCIPVKYKE